MSPEFRSLLSKEWSERRRMFQQGTTMFLVFLGYSIAYELEYKTRALVASFHSTALIFGCISAILLAMSTVSGEYSQRTIKFSQSLPVRLSTVAWARLLGAWGSLLIPILVGATVITLLLAFGIVEQAGLRSAVTRLPDRPSLSRLEAIGFLWTVTAVAIALVLHFVTLLSLLGTRCRSEGSVGLLGAIGFLGVLSLTPIRPSLERLGLFLIADWIGALLPQSLAINWGYQEIDGSTYTDLELAPLILGPVLINLFITWLLAAWFTRLYGRRSESAVRANNRALRWTPRIKLPGLISRLPLRFPNRLAALTWLDARQSVPLSLAGLLMAILITLVGMGEFPGQGHSSFLTRLAGELPSTTWFVGGLWGVIVAVAIFSPELKPGLEQFWRSRPITPGSWFWTKFVVGLLAVIITLDMIPAVIAMSLPFSTKRIGIAYFACIPLIHIVMYATAVAAISRIRRPVPAAIVALIFFYVLDSILMSIPTTEKLSMLDVYNRLDGLEQRGNPVDLMNQGYLIVYGFVLLVTVSATLLGCRTLSPSRRFSHRVPTIVALVLCGLLSPANVMGAEPSLTAVIDGIRQREALVHDMKLRVSTDEQRTDAYFNYYRATMSHQGVRVTPTEPARNERKQFELFERLPCRAWSELDSTGTAITTVAFDGAIQRHFTAGHPRASHRSLTTQSAVVPPFQRPESLMAIGGTDLITLLEQAGAVSIVARSESDEEFIDLSFTNPAPGSSPLATTGVTTTRYRVTINATRQYWPVVVVIEYVTADGLLQLRSEITANGWIDAGPLAYPKQITHRAFQQIPTNPNSRTNELELFLTKESEVTDVAVNTGIPDEIFAPKFPAGLIFDENERKYIEVDSDGEEHAYVPTPKGIRGAVAAYQLLILAAGVVYLFRRQTVA